jgi:hypothetical protein
MTNLTSEEFKALELSFCPFGLVPGAKGRTLMWWAEEKVWIAAFPSREVAESFIIGRDWPRHPGWDRSDVGVDVTAALYEYRKRTGSFLQFEFNSSHDVMDLYGPLGLATEFVSRLVFYEVSAVSPELHPDDVPRWSALVSRLLADGGVDRKTAELVAPAVTQLMFKQTAAQVALVDGINCRGHPEIRPGDLEHMCKLSLDEVREMDEEELADVNVRFDLGLKLRGEIEKKADAVIAGLKAIGHLEE